MCGIVGFTNLKQELEEEKYKYVLLDMLSTIARRGPNEDGIYITNNVMLGHKRLIVIDPTNRETTNEL